MRRTHLRGHTNILKQLLVHIAGFNLGLLMRTLIGVGTPRGMQGRMTKRVAASELSNACSICRDHGPGEESGRVVALSIVR